MDLNWILPRRHKDVIHRSFGFSSTRGRQVVVWLAVADLMASIGVFVRSFLWLYVKDLVPAVSDSLSSVVFCAVSSAWIQFFYTATWFWTLCYAFDVRRMLKSQSECPICYHITAWLSPALLTSAGLFVLYAPDANCHDVSTLSGALTHIMPNYGATFLPMAAIMIVNPILYCCSTQDVKFIISVRLGQYTQKERNTVDGIKTKFLFITLTFYICWLPNLICGVLLWSLWVHLPQSVIVSLWYVMAVMNPLQALLNAMVYRRWSCDAECISWPCSPCGDSSPLSVYSQPHSFNHVAPLQDEDTPLLRSHEDRIHNTRMSINGI
ncbi:G-protein coupled receptor 143-like isoform X2 [Zootermopsis nevadensis]|uniref:G-protein coupled receptor 143-like isoform X2 n=1 Tax=Zootermopsis nevadensis TaxID=136037 RepID=UPI000B8E3242|nr:G-protein coupled receptor 143-like isoform X2 [Zootermopsis nevadensis]